jgi:ethanolamine ammonia-lyase large subunit
MAAAVSKIMRNQDLIAVARAMTVTSAFRRPAAPTSAWSSPTGCRRVRWSSTEWAC